MSPKRYCNTRTNFGYSDGQSSILIITYHDGKGNDRRYLVADGKFVAKLLLIGKLSQTTPRDGLVDCRYAKIINK